MKLKLVLITALVVPILAEGPRVRPVYASRDDQALTASTELGQTYIAAREIKVDLDFPSGESGKGKLFILFDPSSGLFLLNYGWEQNTYPTVRWISDVETRSRVGVVMDRLFVVGFANGVVITDSRERASSLDDAEAKSLRWADDHIGEIETRSWSRDRVTSLAVSRGEFPKGFFQSDYDARSILPIKLVDMVYSDGGFELTLESIDTKQRVKLQISYLLLTRPGVKLKGNEWRRGSIYVDEAQKEE